jgi:hypothetical protein
MTETTFTALMSDHEENVERPKPDRLDHDQVRRPDALQLVRQE